MKRHRWEDIPRSGGKAQRCTNPDCQVQRFLCPLLGWIHSILWGQLQAFERYPCPTQIKLDEPQRPSS